MWSPTHQLPSAVCRQGNDYQCKIICIPSMRKMCKAQYEFWQEKAIRKEPWIPCGLSQPVLMATARLLGWLVCSDQGMWPLALTASTGAESQRERCTVLASSRVGACSREYLARCSWLLCQHVWAVAPRCPAPGPLTPSLVSSSHRVSFPLALPVSSPQGCFFSQATGIPFPSEPPAGSAVSSLSPGCPSCHPWPRR